jgi:hypothetical protein
MLVSVSVIAEIAAPFKVPVVPLWGMTRVSVVVLGLASMKLAKPSMTIGLPIGATIEVRVSPFVPTQAVTFLELFVTLTVPVVILVIAGYIPA